MIRIMTITQPMRSMECINLFSIAGPKVARHQATKKNLAPLPIRDANKNGINANPNAPADKVKIL
jgi:hypothetical protein